MATADALELPSGDVFTFSEWGDFPIWSRVEFDAGLGNDVLAFGYTESQDIPGGASNAQATLYDTNMDEPGQLPVDQTMVVMSIQIRFDESQSDNDTENGKVVQADTPSEGLLKWANLVQNMLFQFTITNQKPMAEGPLTEFPTGGGLYLQQGGAQGLPATPSPTTAPTPGVLGAAYDVNNGFPTAEAARLLALPLRIGTLQPFKGRFKPARGTVPTGDVVAAGVYGLTTFLYGPRQRPVG